MGLRDLFRFKQSSKAKKKPHRLLLLGSGGAGKSTIFKQIRCIHGKISDEERKVQANAIKYNCRVHIQEFINYLTAEKVAFSENSASPKYIELLRSRRFDQSPALVAEWMENLWRDPVVKKAFEEGMSNNKFDIPACAKYFFDNIQRIADENYIPTDEDWILHRAPSSGIIEMSIQVDSVQATDEFTIIDVGGQICEREKWIHAFGNVTMIIFVASLAEYDRPLMEDWDTNSLLDAQYLFKQILSWPWFKNTPMVIFFNKIDLFKQKIKTVDLSKCWEEYNKGSDEEAALQFIMDQFLYIDRERTKNFPVHVTCATDTNSMKEILNSVQRILLKDSLNNSNMM